MVPSRVSVSAFPLQRSANLIDRRPACRTGAIGVDAAPIGISSRLGDWSLDIDSVDPNRW